jgi:hypothetical protein
MARHGITAQPKVIINRSATACRALKQLILAL